MNNLYDLIKLVPENNMLILALQNVTNQAKELQDKYNKEKEINKKNKQIISGLLAKTHNILKETSEKTKNLDKEIKVMLKNTELPPLVKATANFMTMAPQELSKDQQILDLNGTIRDTNKLINLLMEMNLSYRDIFDELGTNLEQGIAATQEEKHEGHSEKELEEILSEDPEEAETQLLLAESRLNIAASPAPAIPAAPAPAAPAPANLPPNWKELKNESGKNFYFNSQKK